MPTAEEVGAVIGETLGSALSMADAFAGTLKRPFFLSRQPNRRRRQRDFVFNLASIAAFQHAMFSAVPPEEGRRVMDALWMGLLHVGLPPGHRFATGGLDAIRAVFQDIASSLSDVSFEAQENDLGGYDLASCGAYRLLRKCGQLVGDAKSPDDVTRFIPFYSSACSTYLGWVGLCQDSESWRTIHSAARILLKESGVNY